MDKTVSSDEFKDCGDNDDYEDCDDEIFFDTEDKVDT